MLSALRKKTKKFSLFLAKPIAKIGVSPNAVSTLAIPMALCYAFFALQGNFAFALLFAVLAVSMDFIDGSVAELQKKRSLFGNYFETMIDKIVDFIVFGVWVFAFPAATILAVGLSFLSSYAKPRVALVIITDNRDWPAIGEHADKLSIMLIAMAVSIFFPKILGFALIEIALFAVAAISAIGTVQRIGFAKKLIEEAEKSGAILPYLREKKER